MLFTTLGFPISIANIFGSEGASSTTAMPKQDLHREQSKSLRLSSRKPVPSSRSKGTMTTSAAPLHLCSKAPRSQPGKERSKYKSSQANLGQTDENCIKSLDNKDPNCAKAKNAPTKYVFRIIELSSNTGSTNITSNKSASKRTESIAQASEAASSRDSSRTRKAPSRSRYGLGIEM